jgi:hypothetical protein
MKERHTERKLWLLLALVALAALVLLSERGLGAPEASATAPPKTIDICKVTVPPGGSGFPFTWASGSSPQPSFALNDGQCQTFNVTNQDKYNVFTEIVPAGWTLKNIACTYTTSSVNIIGATPPAAGFQPGDNAVTIDLNEPHVTCTFTNSQAGPPPNPPCTGAAGAAFLDISTGTGAANSGIPDPIWTVSSGGPAYPVGPPTNPPNWFVAQAGSNWIHAGNNTGVTGQPLGTYVYETRFDVPAGVASLTLAFQFAADNNVSFVLLDPQGAATQINPVLTGVVNTNNFNKLHSTNPPTIVVVPLSGLTNLKPGKYTLRATVGNDPGTATGLLVVGNVTCAPKTTPTPTPTAPPTRTPTPTPRKECGDVNDDGTVNALDALAILQYSAGLTHDLPNLPSADVNGDGTVNALDALLVLQQGAGYDVPFRC